MSTYIDLIKNNETEELLWKKRLILQNSSKFKFLNNSVKYIAIIIAIIALTASIIVFIWFMIIIMQDSSDT